MLLSCESMFILLPRTHVQGVKWSVLSVVVSTKITRSEDLGIWATHKYSISVDIVEKLASLCFESFGKAHVHHKYFILLAMHKGRQQAYACRWRWHGMERLSSLTLTLQHVGYVLYSIGVGRYWTLEGLNTYDHAHFVSNHAHFVRLWLLSWVSQWKNEL